MVSALNRGSNKMTLRYTLLRVESEANEECNDEYRCETISEIEFCISAVLEAGTFLTSSLGMGATRKHTHLTDEPRSLSVPVSE